MNITFLIGNGFDIGLGLKSSFKDFFPIFQAHYHQKHGKLEGIAKELSEDEDKWSYFERQLGQYTAKFGKNESKEYVAQVREFEIDFVDYLSKQEKELDYSNTELIKNTMIDGLLGFYKTTVLRVESANIIQNTFRAHSTENKNYYFINYNYTNCLDKCLQCIPEKTIKKDAHQRHLISKTMHIHGHMDSDPIMGVNDKSQIANEDLACDKRFTKYIVKPIINSSIRMNYDREATELIDISDIICIYGMSLGETDKKWWKQIVGWLEGKQNRQLIVFLYNPNYSERTPVDWMTQEDEIIDLLSFLSDNKNIEPLRSRIHLAVNKNIFQMNLRKKGFVEDYKDHVLLD